MLRYNAVPYIHIEYVEPLGDMPPDLSSVILGFADAPLTREYLNSISIFITQVLDALRFLEREDANFLHGDIKPSNILMASEPTDDGMLGLTGSKLTDFGMSNFRAVERKGFYLGDSYYLGPEVYTMAPDSVKDLDQAARRALDVYALGCTTFEAVFRCRWQVLDRYSRIPITLSDLGTDLKKIALSTTDAYFRDVVGCLSTWLEKDPGSRPSSYQEMLDQWTALMERNGISFGWVKVPNPSPGKSGYPLLEDNVIYVHLRNKGHHPDVAAEVTRKLFAGGSLRSVGKLKEADETFDAVLELMPGFPPALSAKATSLLFRRDYAGAARLLGKAIEGYYHDASLVQLDPLGFGSVLTNYSQALSELPGSALARLSAEAAAAGARVLPSEAKSHFSVAKAQLRLNNLSAAQDAVARGLEIDPASKFGRSLLCAVILTTGHGPPVAETFAPDEVLSGEVMLSTFARFRVEDAAGEGEA